MKTHDGVITSLGDLVRWLGDEAQALGVDIFPMTAAVDVLTDADGAVDGIVTGDLGLDRAGNPKPGYAAGIGIRAKYTLIGEGARGSLAKQLIQRFGLDARSLAAEISVSASRRSGRSRQSCTSPAGSIIISASRSTTRPAAAASAITPTDRQAFISASSSISTTATRRCRPSTSSSASSSTPRSHACSRARRRSQLWRARADLGRLAVDPRAGLSRRRADRLRRRLHERPAPQGHPQRHPLRHRRRRRRSPRRWPRAARMTASSDLPARVHRHRHRRASCAASATSSRSGRASARCSACCSAASTCGCNRCSASRPSARCSTRKADADALWPVSATGEKHLSAARRQDHFRPRLLGLSRQYRP